MEEGSVLCSVGRELADARQLPALRLGFDAVALALQRFQQVKVADGKERRVGGRQKFTRAVCITA